MQTRKDDSVNLPTTPFICPLSPTSFPPILSTSLSLRSLSHAIKIPPLSHNPSQLPPQRAVLQFAALLKGVQATPLVCAPVPYMMARKDPPWCLLLLVILLHVAASSSASDSETLLGFKDYLANDSALASWNDSTSPCSGDKGNWVGVLCSEGTIWGLQVENMGLMGIIDVDSLARLLNLRTISFMNNSFDGPLPDLKKLGALKSLFLSNNRFSGEIPDDAFAGMLSLKKVHLAQNGFTGEIPASLTMLPKLLELRLEGNQFEGRIPDFQLKELQSLNVSNNALDGLVPTSLKNMNLSSFLGNKDLCGEPLEPCKSTSKKVSPVMIAIFVIVVGVTVLAIVACMVIHRHRNQTSQSGDPPSNLHKKVRSGGEIDRMEQGSSISENSGSKGKKSSSSHHELGKLSFVRDDRERFDLQDLLKASAEILGSGSFGSSYKASLLSGAMMVVKRYRQMNNVGKEEFQGHVRRLGRLTHPNLLPLVAYYYRKEEKLLVSDFVHKGSLAFHLHGNRGGGQPSLDWLTRLKIIKGVAKGLAYLYNELPSLITPHAHLKSSNVLLDESFEPLLTDYGLLPMINQEHAQELMVAYKSPEYTQHGRITKKTDVWSLGILILEILTGKFPANYLQQGKGNGNGSEDLASWVNSVVREEWTGEVFDNEMGTRKNCEGELLKLLKIGLGCCESDVEKRWDLKESVERIEELREKDSDDEFYSSYASEGDMYSSKGFSDEFSFKNE